MSGYFLRITPEGGVGAGSHRFDEDQLTRFRQAVADTRSRSRLLGAVVATKKAGYPVRGEHCRRLPPGYQDAPESAHPLLRHNALWVGEDEPAPKSLTTNGFVGWVTRRWEKLEPLHRWLANDVG